MRLPLIIDGVDFTAYAQRNGYQISYEDRKGANGGTMLDGSITVDIVKRAEVLSIPLNPLDGEDFSALLRAVMKDYVTATVWDTKENEERTAVFIPSITNGSLAIITDTVKFWNGAVLKLREK